MERVYTVESLDKYSLTESAYEPCLSDLHHVIAKVPLSVILTDPNSGETVRPLCPS